MKPRIVIGFIICTALLSCTRPEKNHFPNVIVTKTFGDTARLEVEKKTDSVLVQHYLLMHGDSVVNVYDTKLSYKKILSDSNLNSTFYLAANGYRFYFDEHMIAAHCDSLLAKLTSDYDKSAARPLYENLRNRALHATNPAPGDTSYQLHNYPELLFHLESKFVNAKTGEKPGTLLVEYYESGYASGETFYIITPQTDTVKLMEKKFF